jgi:hypothetical protein
VGDKWVGENASGRGGGANFLYHRDRSKFMLPLPLPLCYWRVVALANFSRSATTTAIMVRMTEAANAEDFYLKSRKARDKNYVIKPVLHL